MKTEEEILIEAEEWAKKKKDGRTFGQRVSMCTSTEEYQTEAYIAGYEACKNEIMSIFVLISKDYETINSAIKKSLRTK